MSLYAVKINQSFKKIIEKDVDGDIIWIQDINISFRVMICTLGYHLTV